MVTATGGDEGSDRDLRGVLLSVVDAYRYMGISVRRYVTLVLLPLVSFTAVVLGVLVAFPVPLGVGVPLVLLGMMGTVVGVFYPKFAQDRRSKEIRERFHLFLTHITVLSMTNIDRVEIFRTLANVDEYGALAEEMGHVVALVDTWNQSLDDACMMRSKRVSSDLLSDFLERLAYTVGAGQRISDFLIDEQDSMIQQFVIRYESDLAQLDVLKDLYLSMMLSTMFILVFATIVPLLVGIPPAYLVGGIALMFGIVQGGFLFVVHTVAPWDPVWYHSAEKETPASNVVPWLQVGLAGTVVLAILVLALSLGVLPAPRDVLPVSVYASIVLTPLLLPAVMMRREEERVKDRDRGFPSFIRTLGGVESVKQTSTVNVLSTLRDKNFGALTADIDNLYRRLNARIDSTEAWKLFAADTGSYLIQKFGDMYVVGRRMGGDPKTLGQVLSTNFDEVLHVREQRKQATTTFIGTVYGITAAAIFSAYIGLGIAEQLLVITETLNSTDSDILGMLFHPGVYNVELIRLLLVVVVLVNALLSSLMIRVIDRGHTFNAYFHFILLTWVGALVSVLTQWVMGSLVSF